MIVAAKSLSTDNHITPLLNRNIVPWVRKIKSHPKSGLISDRIKESPRNIRLDGEIVLEKWKKQRLHACMHACC